MTEVAITQLNRQPRWVTDLCRLLPIRSQFIFSENIRDLCLIPLDSGFTLAPFWECLWDSMRNLGFRFFIVYDPVDGISVYPKSAEAQEEATKLLNLKIQKNGFMPVNLESLQDIIKQVVNQIGVRAGVALDFASRLTMNPQHLEKSEHNFFAACEKLSLVAEPVAVEGFGNGPLFNPVIWLLNRAQDLPSWFVLDSERISSHVIGKPDYESRANAAQYLAQLFGGYENATEAELRNFSKMFTDSTDGMTLQSMADITNLADQQGILLKDIEDAVRCYKVGQLDNPWKKDHLREKIRNGLAVIAARVKGQHPAAVKTIDILTRSVMGLTGAQSRSVGSRPRGVLFFAGPTGVGKTELAKTLTQMIFGDEQAYIRFDMSEFSSEHAGDRLLGAPPGYVGYDAGGELTNAVKQKPHSVILFDEIEKGHERLLDKFLQILEDGRLTDGRGETVYFSESIIIFTSNLGIVVDGPDGKKVQSVKPGDSYEDVERTVRKAIEHYFKYKISRPELLNRIGENIVIFNFITPDVAEQIFDSMIENVTRRVRDEHGLSLKISGSSREKLLKWCTDDLENGGRGIGNQLESCFINPLARAMFAMDLSGRKEITVEDAVEQEKVFSLTLS